MGFSLDEINGLFDHISNRAASKLFYLKEFRYAIYGNELQDMSRVLYRIEEKLRGQAKAVDLFFQGQHEQLPFKTFAEIVQKIEPNIKCEEIDLLASKMDTNADGFVSKTEFQNLFHEYLDFNEFKRLLIRYAQENGKQIQDLFYMSSMEDGISKDDFFKFAQTISKGTLSIMSKAD
jgi:Ca2+-binding EF-hand superfamily protein